MQPQEQAKESLALAHKDVEEMTEIAFALEQDGRVRDTGHALVATALKKLNA